MNMRVTSQWAAVHIESVWLGVSQTESPRSALGLVPGAAADTPRAAACGAPAYSATRGSGTLFMDS